ncbi:MAG: hypothetical protein ACRERD_08810 [Candidatus Binatia bacterium]
MAATFAVSGNGYAKGKFEPLMALGHDFNVDANLFLYRPYRGKALPKEPSHLD